MNFLNGIYTLLEIAINYNFNDEDMEDLKFLLDNNREKIIPQRFPILENFLPYCKYYNINGNKYFGMPAYVYDTYQKLGIFPESENVDIEPQTDKLEYWQYVPCNIYNIETQTGFDFAKNQYKTDDIWNIFLSGSARMDYYEGKKTELQQRIKYAIVEYMLRRPQFYTMEDFVDNPILHKKYNKNEREN